MKRFVAVHNNALASAMVLCVSLKAIVTSKNPVRMPLDIRSELNTWLSVRDSVSYHRRRHQQSDLPLVDSRR